MSYLLTYTFSLNWTADGAGQLNQESGQAFTFEETGFGQYVAGGAAPTSAQISAACTAAGADMATQLTTQPTLAKILSAASGGPYF